MAAGAPSIESYPSALPATPSAGVEDRDFLMLWNATMRTLVWGTMPVGALAGGVLGSVPTIVLAGAMTSCACLWLLLRPVRLLREFPGSESR